MARNASSPTARPATGGRSGALRVVLNLLLLAGIGVAGWMILEPAIRTAGIRSDIRVASGEAEALFEAFERYFERHQAYPNAYADPGFDPETLEPMRRRGYYKGFAQTKLLDGRIDAFDSPDDKGPNQEFWLEMTLASDPSVRFLVANSNDAPLSGGKWREGAFIWRDGVLEQL